MRINFTGVSLVLLLLQGGMVATASAAEEAASWRRPEDAGNGHS